MPNLIEITEFSAPELDIYARLTENQLVNRADPENALFVAESPLVIGRALDAGCTPVSFLMERKHIEGKGAEVLARCPADIPVYAADLPVLTQLTGFHLTRGMLCAMRRPRLPSVAEVCANARRIAVLENIMNPTNIGAIFRSAAALNVDAVLLTAAGSDPLYRRAARVSMGNVFLVPWTYLPEGESWPELLMLMGDLERLGDHAMNLLESGEELRDRKIELPPEDRRQLRVLTEAVEEIADLALAAFRREDAAALGQVEALEQVIDGLRQRLRARRIRETQPGEGAMELSFVWSDVLTDLERAADHCCNIMECVADLSAGNRNLHAAQLAVRQRDPAFDSRVRAYEQKYRI